MISRTNIFLMNGNILISVWTTLLMPKAQDMTNFMNYCGRGTKGGNRYCLNVPMKSSNSGAASGEI